MLRSAPGDPVLGEDLSWEQSTSSEILCAVLPQARFGKYSCFCLGCLWSVFVTQTYSNLVIGWEGSAGPLRRLQLSPEAPSFGYSLSGMCLRDLAVVVTFRMCLAQSSTIRKCFEFLYYFFQEFPVDCRSVRDPMKLCSPPSQPVWGHVCGAMLCRSPKLRCHGHLTSWSLFTNFALSGRRGFLKANPRFLFCNHKSITSVLRTHCRQDKDFLGCSRLLCV